MNDVEVRTMNEEDNYQEDGGCCSCNNEDIVRISPDHVTLRSMLGMGSFSEVYAVNVKEHVVVVLDRIMADTDCDAMSVSSNLTDSTGYLSSSSSKAGAHPKQPPASKHHQQQRAGRGYALKRLRPNIVQDNSNENKESRAQAVQDLQWEVELLNKLPAHANIISLIAVSENFFTDPETGFVILERVTETLEFRLKRWQLKAQRHLQRKLEQDQRSIFSCLGRLVRPWGGAGGGGGAKGRKLGLEYERHQELHRLETCATGIARAMEHLHHHGILYRDLKPANIGFAVNGSVRLFDFGLAVSISETEKLQGVTGSPGYMAPEVALCQLYGLSADVYSFGMVLWHVCTMDAPYNNSNATAAKDDASWTSVRPSLARIAWPEIRSVLTKCWDPEPDARPTFAQLSQTLHSFLRVGGTAHQKL